MMSLICALAVAATLRPQLEAIAKLPGEPSLVSASGMTTVGDPMLTIENGSAFDVAAGKRRLVIIGSGSDEHVAEAVLSAVRWMKTDAPADIRDRWVVSAMPAVAASTDPHVLNRWTTFQA